MRVRGEQVARVGLILQESGKSFLDARQSEQRHRPELAGIANHRRGIEIGQGIFHGQHEGRLPGSQQNIAGQQGAGAVVAFDEQLRLAERPHVKAGGQFPNRLVQMAGAPLDDVLDATLRLVVEPVLGGFEMLGKFGAQVLVWTAQDDIVQFEQVLMLAHGKNVDAPINQDIDVRIAGQQVVDDLVAHRVPLRTQLLVDGLELSLHLAQG